MPQIIAANVDTKSGVVSWVGWDGRKATSRLTGFPSGVTEAQVLAIINAMGTLSNAAIWKQEFKSVSEASIPASTAYDESISQVERGINITYQNTVTLATKIFRVPAPHHENLTADGRFMRDRADDADVEALLTAIETALGASWVFVSAPLSTRGVGTDSSIELPLHEEPTP